MVSKLFSLRFLIFSISGGLLLTLLSNTAFSHVVPEDQLRNKVYLTKTQALKSAFKGTKKIRRGKRRLTKTQRQKINQALQQTFNKNQVEFYSGVIPGIQKYTAIFDKAAINSHPPTLAKIMVLFDRLGAVSLIKILEYKGPQRAEILSEAFLNQFIGKTSESDFSQITSNQGETQTLQAVREAIKRTALIFDVIIKGN